MKFEGEDGSYGVLQGKWGEMRGMESKERAKE